MNKKYQYDIINIIGFNRVGKTTLAEAIKEKQQPSEIIPFAKTLKEEIIDMGFSKEWLNRKSPKARALMRAYGDARREIDSEYFIKKWQSTIDDIKNKSLIVDDAYQINENNAILSTFSHFNPKIAYIYVYREGFYPKQKEIEEFDSVSQAVELYKIYESNINHIKQTNKSIYEINMFVDVHLPFSKEVILNFQTARHFVVYNKGRTLDEYKVLISEEIIPTICEPLK